jgi:hypothetical protein
VYVCSALFDEVERPDVVNDRKRHSSGRGERQKEANRRHEQPFASAIAQVVVVKLPEGALPPCEGSFLLAWLRGRQYRASATNVFGQLP